MTTWRKTTRAAHLALMISASLALISVVFAAATFSLTNIEGRQTLARANRLLDRGERDLDAVEAQSKEGAHTLGIVLRNMAAISDTGAKMVVFENLYWKQQLRQGQELMARLNDSAESMNTLVRNTDDNLNGQALPEMTATFEDMHGRFNRIADDADEQIGKFGKIQDNLIATSAGLATVVENPDIPETFEELQGSAADLHAVTTHYRKLLNGPKGIFWPLLKLLRPAADTAQIVNAVRK